MLSRLHRLVKRWAWAALLVPALATAQSFSTHAEAARTLDALRAAQPQAMPRLADPQAGAALRALTDSARFLDGASRAPDSELPDLCERDRTLMVDYLAFGAMQQGQLSTDVMARNAVTYQDEIALLQGFVARCLAKQVPPAEALLRQIGQAQASRLRLGGLQRRQTALLQIYVVVAAHCPIDSTPDAPYCRQLDTLAELAPVHARALSLATRATLGGLMVPLLARASGERKAAVQRILDALSDARCTGLCQLQQP